ncbi:Crossover junction endonuclease mus81 [Ancistrocladus abbreviatus]
MSSTLLEVTRAFSRTSREARAARSEGVSDRTAYRQGPVVKKPPSSLMYMKIKTLLGGQTATGTNVFSAFYDRLKEDGDTKAQEKMLRKQSNNTISVVASRNIFQLVWGK